MPPRSSVLLRLEAPNKRFSRSSILHKPDFRAVGDGRQARSSTPLRSEFKSGGQRPNGSLARAGAPADPASHPGGTPPLIHTPASGLEDRLGGWVPPERAHVSARLGAPPSWGAGSCVPLTLKWMPVWPVGA